MAQIDAPQSPKCQKFAARRRGEAEMPLAFRSVLLALVKSAYPGMDQVVDGVERVVAYGSRVLSPVE
ncbi:unnamed protein product [Lampetra planeri]